MSFINDIAFVERVDELEVEGNLTVGGDILLQGEFPKIDQKIVTATNSLNSSISLKANQSDLDVVVVTLNMKADHEEVVASLSLKADQSELDSALSSVDSRIDGVDDLLGTKANQSALDTLETRASVLEDDLTSNASRVEVLETDLSSNASRLKSLKPIFPVTLPASVLSRRILAVTLGV
jgi:flagellin-like hook-associated protein FlgL